MDILQRSVGKDSSNMMHDVKLVQQLLNHQFSFMASRPRLDITGRCGSDTIDAIIAYQRNTVSMIEPTGRIDPGSQTLRQLLFWTAGSRNLADAIRATQALQSPSFGPIVPVSIVAPGGGKNQKFTNDPQEVEMTTTNTASPAQIVDALRAAWPELTVDGAHMLVAQWGQETGFGKSCHNWNLGNLKVSTHPKSTDRYMYLTGTWECYKPNAAAQKIAEGNGLAAYPSTERAHNHGWKCGEGKILVVFTPPHRECRFFAFATLGEGAMAWSAFF